MPFDIAGIVDIPLMTSVVTFSVCSAAPSAVSPDVSLDPAATLDAAIPHWIPHAMRLARRLTGSAHDGEDLVQATLLKAARSAHTYRNEASPKTWLYRILINTFRDLPKRPPHLHLAPDVLATNPASPADQAEVSELRQAVDIAILTLAPRQREVLVLSREGLNGPEIANALQTSEPNVRKLLQLARARLRILLAAHLREIDAQNKPQIKTHPSAPREPFSDADPL